MKRISILITIFCCLTVVSWSQKIGFLMDSYITDRWYMDQKFLTEKIKELGGECLVEIPYGDADEQIKLGQKLINSKVDVLIIVPSNAVKAATIVAEAKKANIPVISYDRMIESADLAFYISFDNERVGQLQAEFALSKVPEGNYILINGPVSDYNGILYRKGQLSVLDPHIKSGKVKLMVDEVLSDWSEMEAMMKMTEVLGGKGPHPHAIVAANDALANGAILSLGKDQLGKVVITGQDADLIGMKNIVAGNQTMTVYKPIKLLAERAAEIAMQLAKTRIIENKPKMKFGDYEVQCELLSPIVVDKNNYMDTVVKDGQIKATDLVETKN